MRVIQSVRKWHFLVLAFFILLAFIVFKVATNNTSDSRITTTVEKGSVTESVSVSGFVEAKNTANLSFPTVGIVTDVFVYEGQNVTKGTLLATLGSRTLVAQRTEAVASLQKAQAVYDALVTGPRDEAREVTAATLTSAESAYEQTLALEAEKVAKARTALLSNNLAAYAMNGNSRATPPTITGSYTCTAEGTYTISPYRSGTFSGYSYTLSGLEEGTDAAYTQQPAALGACGLSIQFTEDDNYAVTEWEVPVPNPNSSTYLSYRNAYELALQTQEQAIQSSKNNVVIAANQTRLANATPTNEALRQAQAAITQALGTISAIDSQIEEKSIVAPFDGIITNVDILPGETAGTSPIITLLAEDAFTLTARIPEIDITKIRTGQKTETIFDAQSSDVFTGEITFVSPLATEIDGVAYFETTITLADTPTWIRSGLNADVDIFIDTQENVLRIPKRYIITKDRENTVLLLNPQKPNEDPIATPVEILFTGNDGYVAIDNLSVGTTIVAP